ncbi:MAG: PD-(D/E)XK nuclease family protein [Acidimicrobiales bacterium]
MGMTLVRTAYGPPAARALRDAVAAAKGGEPLAPVTVVVPSNHVGVATRRLLSSGSLGPVAGTGVGLAAVTFVTPYRLAELLAASALAGQGKRPVSTPVLAAAVRAELAAAPGLFQPVAEHPATESALVTTYRELRDLSPAALDALAAASQRAAEVVRIHRATRARLEAAWSDEEDLLTAATALAGSPAVAALGTLVVHLPQRLSQHSARLLVALAAHVPTTVVAGGTGVPGADTEMAGSLARLGLDAGDDPSQPAPVAVDRTLVLTASDGDEEVRAAVRAVVDAARSGTRLDRIAVLHASPEPYARLTHDQLRAAGVTTNGAAVTPLSGRVAGRTLLDLLALPDGGFRRQDVFAWLSSAPVLHGGRLAPTTAWERLSRKAAVVAGRDHWDHHLSQLAAHDEERAADAELDDDEPEWKPGRLRTEAAQARELRDFVLRLIDDLARATAAPRRWSEHAAWAQRWLHHLLGGADRRERWWDDVGERKAAERVEEALHRLRALDAVEGPVPLDVFHRTLEIELEHDLGRVGRFGEGVLVGSVEMGIGLDLDLVVVLGLAEGSFPATVRDDSLLPDHERSRTGGELPLRQARVERQHHQLLAALAGAHRHLLCVPRGDLRRSAERVPSRWVLDLCTDLAGSVEPWWTADLAATAEPWVRHVASFDDGLRRLENPATAQEHRLRALLAAHGDLVALDDVATSLGAEVIGARRSDRFTRFDGNLAGLPVPSPVDRITSPTRLERWAGCPHRHLVEDLLRAAPVENPEDNLMITPIDKGSLVHEALERFLLSVLERPMAARPQPGQPWTEADLDHLLQIGGALCDQYEARGLVGRPIFWTRDRRRILADLEATLACDSEHRAAHRSAPLFAELAFGFVAESIEAVEVRLPDGRILRVRGRIDRVDVAADGTIHVVDYKTGRYADAYRALLGDDPVGGGTKLQLPLYGLAGRVARGEPGAPVHAEYWFVTRDGAFARCGYDITDDVLERTVEVLDVIVRGIDHGVFPPHPPATSTYFRIACHVCDPDGLGTAELRKQWDRKRDDPALAEYAHLAEPLEVEA